ncbi:hypothetical protein DPMN_029379 [Dreissena polymorpha]|uniref:Uncharacterized protein n=1 Tax=Dreissena polymorpha TaxID=45954 RepID=A0A9D4LX32_DREPO|nr:hypothetical protein DPMN_029379 [Dreissena polymorpha]
MCQKFVRDNPSFKINKFNVAALASNAYVKALSNSNLKVFFQKAGIYPLDRTAVPVDNFKPSEPYVGLDPTPVSSAEQSDVDSYFKAAEFVFDKKKEYNKTAINKTLRSVVSGQEITRSDIRQEMFSKAQSQPLCEPPAPKKRKNKSNVKNCKRSVSSQKNNNPFVAPFQNLFLVHHTYT